MLVGLGVILFDINLQGFQARRLLSQRFIESDSKGTFETHWRKIISKSHRPKH